MNENIAKVLLSEEEIQKRVKELGRQIHDDYKDKEKIVMIGLLKGAIYFFTDLSLAIDLPLRIDFMVASSYGSGTETSGNVDIRLSCSENIEGCHVLLVDDIIDSGVTMEAITRLLMAQKPASVKKVARLRPGLCRRLPQFAVYRRIKAGSICQIINVVETGRIYYNIEMVFVI